MKKILFAIFAALLVFSSGASAQIMTEDFDSGAPGGAVFPPTGWILHGTTGSSWIPGNTPYAGTYNAATNVLVGGEAGLINCTWCTVPLVDPILEFWYRGGYSTYYVAFTAEVATTRCCPSQFIPVWDSGSFNLPDYNDAYTNAVVDLSAYAGMDVLIGFRCYQQDSLSYDLQVDNVLIASRTVATALGPESFDPPPGPVQFSYDATAASGLAGNAGAEFDGTYFYTTRWASNLIHQYDNAGNLLKEFSVPGVTGLRDLAWDGTYMYGGAASTTIYCFDPIAETLITTITSPVAVRSIAYDSVNDAFWVNNWAETLTLVNRSGVSIDTIPTPPSMYGCAYDNVSAGGPYLWIFTGTTTGGGCQLEQYDLNTKTLTALNHNLGGDLGGGIAGGLFFTTAYSGGTSTIGGLMQGDTAPDTLFGYDADNFPTASFPPTGWTTRTAGGGANPWYQSTAHDGACASVDDGPLASTHQDEWLITPTIDCSAITSTHLTFWDYFYRSTASGDSTAEVLGSTDDGTTWTQVIASWMLTNTSGMQDFDISAWADGQSQVKIAFRLTSTAETSDFDYWDVDDIWVGSIVESQVCFEGFEEVQSVQWPAGWYTVLYSGDGDWNLEYAGSDTYEPPNAAGLYADCDDDDIMALYDAGLFSPSVDLTGLTSVNLAFDRNFQDFAGSGQAEIRTYSSGGLEAVLLWLDVDDPSAGVSTLLNFDPSGYADPSDVAFEFWYTDDGYGSAWKFAVDNVVVTAGPAPPPLMNEVGGDDENSPGFQPSQGGFQNPDGKQSTKSFMHKE